MIKPNELRIGNWLITAKGIPQQVVYVGETIGFNNEIGGTDKYQKNPIFSYDIEDLSPIPLTPEILVRCGFEKEEPLGWYKKGFMDVFEGNPFHYASGNNLCPDIHSLRQLQNLFFSLTGEELEIKPW